MRSVPLNRKRALYMLIILVQRTTPLFQGSEIFEQICIRNFMPKADPSLLEGTAFPTIPHACWPEGAARGRK